MAKSPTGVSGFDDITGGGVPTGRPTLVCGGAGCGKSLFAVEFLVRGAVEFGEPGVLMTFEESVDDIRKNVASLGFDVDQLAKEKKLVIDHVVVRREEIEENGEYDLEGLFIRIAHSVAKIKARRIVLDTIETLFAGLQNQGVLRAELQRLFRWLKTEGLTTVITGERGEGQLTRHGLEEYVSDCVVLLDHRVTGQVSTRRLRVVKYRGSTHGTNEYPFLIDEDGISVLPITGHAMDYAVSSERVGTGVAGLDEMLGGRGIYRGSAMLISGTAGTGKTSLAMHFAEAACQRGEKCLYFSFEESPKQLVRNARSIGIHLQSHLKKGRLTIESARPTMYGLEMHLVRLHKQIEQAKPQLVVLDPISNLSTAGGLTDSANMLVRLMDYLRKQQITGVFVSLTSSGNPLEATEEGISSMADAWLLSRDVEENGERNRILYVLKARGISHSNQLREFLITHKGVQLVPAYVGSQGVATGSSRLSQEAKERAQAMEASNDLARQKALLAQRQKVVAAQVAALRAGLLAEEEEFKRVAAGQEADLARMEADRQAMRRSRRDQTSAKK